MLYKTEKVTQVSEAVVQGWFHFWGKRWSLFLEWYTNPFHLNISNCRTNLFFSINWYKISTKNRKEHNVSQFNSFFFDIDLKDNPNISKTFLQVKILEYTDFFDFIVESRNWYHLYILLSEWKYAINDKEEYLNDWKKKADELENIMDIYFDKKCFDTTRIARIPWTLHKKQWDTDYFAVKLIKWQDLLFPKYQKRNQINSIPINQILDVLNIEYRWTVIYQDWLPTNWYRINREENYINDFSNTRPVWEPFAFIKHYFTQQLKLLWQDKDIWLITAKTYGFFKEHFWIIWDIERSKKIIIKKYIEEYIQEQYLSSEKYVIYALIAYFQKKNQVWTIFWKDFIVDINDMIQQLHLNMDIKDVCLNIQNIINKQKKILEMSIFLSGEIKKQEWTYIFAWIFIKEWNTIKSRREFYITHYISFLIFQLNYKNTDLTFYLLLCITLLNKKNETELTVDKVFLSNWLLQDANFSRVQKRIQNIQDLTKNFHFRKTQKQVIFLK